MNIKTLIYQAVRDRILNNTTVKTSRLFNSQYLNEQTENTFAYPAAFIEFLEILYSNLGQGIQEADVTLRIYLGFDSLKTEDLQVLELMDAIHGLLQGFRPVETASPLDRVLEQQDTDHDTVQVWIMDYSFRVVDHSGSRQNRLLSATIEELCIEPNPDKPRLLPLEVDTQQPPPAEDGFPLTLPLTLE